MAKYEINETMDYSLFKFMKGNRAVEGIRKKKIRDSIVKVGYVPNPIIVNEKMEIIDGQGRYEVCMELGLPILYIIVPGAGKEECVAMNISATNWALIDYVNLYISEGKESYVRLKRLYDEHSVPLSVAVCAATGLMTTNNDTVKSGALQLTEAEFAETDAMLEYVDSFGPAIKSNGIGSTAMLKMALCFCYRCPEVDNETMREQFEKYGYRMKNGHGSDEVFECLTDIYNHRRKKDRVYIATEYKKFNDNKYPWYAGKWGKTRGDSE